MKGVKMAAAAILAALSTYITAISAHASTLGDKAKGVVDGAQSEASGFMNVAGMIGIVIAGLLLAVGKRKEAGILAVCVVVAYVVVCYAPQIWTTIIAWV